MAQLSERYRFKNVRESLQKKGNEGPRGLFWQDPCGGVVAQHLVYEVKCLAYVRTTSLQAKKAFGGHNFCIMFLMLLHAPASGLQRSAFSWCWRMFKGKRCRWTLGFTKASMFCHFKCGWKVPHTARNVTNRLITAIPSKHIKTPHTWHSSLQERVEHSQHRVSPSPCSWRMTMLCVEVSSASAVPIASWASWRRVSPNAARPQFPAPGRRHPSTLLADQYQAPVPGKILWIFVQDKHTVHLAPWHIVPRRNLEPPAYEAQKHGLFLNHTPLLKGLSDSSMMEHNFEVLKPPKFNETTKTQCDISRDTQGHYTTSACAACLELHRNSSHVSHTAHTMRGFTRNKHCSRHLLTSDGLKYHNNCLSWQCVFGIVLANLHWYH